MPQVALIAAAIGAAAGAAKYAAVDKPKSERENKLAAETIRYSPWTGMKPNAVSQPSVFNDMLGGAMTGASFGMGNAGALGGAAEGGGAMAENASSPYNFGMGDKIAEVGNMGNSMGQMTGGVNGGAMSNWQNYLGQLRQRGIGNG